MHQKYFRGSSYEGIYHQIIAELHTNPESRTIGRNGELSNEILNLSFELFNPLNRLVWSKARATNYEFAMRFFIWMLNGCDDYEYVADVNPNASKFSEAPKFSTAYGPRIVRQIEQVIDELKRNPGSRRAIIQILNEDDLEMLDTETKEEFPCTESIAFLIRNDELHCQVKMRSNNMVTTVVYDVFNFTMLQEYVLRRLNADRDEPLEMGKYYHMVGSAHYFGSQQGLVDLILSTNEPLLVRKK